MTPTHAGVQEHLQQERLHTWDGGLHGAMSEDGACTHTHTLVQTLVALVDCLMMLMMIV